MLARVSLRKFARLMTHAGAFTRFGFREWFGQPTIWLPAFEQSYHSCSVFMSEPKSVWPSNALQRARLSRSDCNRGLLAVWVLSLTVSQNPAEPLR